MIIALVLSTRVTIRMKLRLSLGQRIRLLRSLRGASRAFNSFVFEEALLAQELIPSPQSVQYPDNNLHLGVV